MRLIAPLVPRAASAGAYGAADAAGLCEALFSKGSGSERVESSGQESRQPFDKPECCHRPDRISRCYWRLAFDQRRDADAPHAGH